MSCSTGTADITQAELTALHQLPQHISSLIPSATQQQSHQQQSILQALVPQLFDAVARALRRLPSYVAEPAAACFRSIRHIRVCILLVDSAAACLADRGVCTQWLQPDQDGFDQLQGKQYIHIRGCTKKH
jgi:hypothetical protein